MAANGHFIDGERLYLREVCTTDVAEGYYRWLSDSEVNRYLESRFYPHSVEQLMEYVKAMQASRTDVFLAMIDKASERHIGNIKLGTISWIHRTADIGLVIGEKEFWGRGYATEAIRMLTEYAFKTLNLRKVWAGAYAGNVGSIQAFIKAGYEKECTRTAHLFCNGVYEDDIILSCFNPCHETSKTITESVTKQVTDLGGLG